MFNSGPWFYVLVFGFAFSCTSNGNYVECDNEKTNGGVFVSNGTGRFESVMFGSTDRRSQDFAHSGKYSTALTSQFPYGMGCTIKNVKAGEIFQFTIWRKKGSNGALMTSFANSEGLNFAQSFVSGKEENEWEEMNLTVIVPTIAADKDMNVFAVHDGSVTTSYFDDLRITYLGFSHPREADTSFIDPRDGKRYEAVKINDVWWMSTNVSFETPSGSYLYDKSDSSSEAGRLYTWDAALDACPEGWTLPGDEDWQELERAFGMPDSISANYGYRGGNVSVRLREFGSSGLNLHYAGNGTDDPEPIFFNRNKAGYYWTSTEIDSNHAWCREINPWPSPGRFKDRKKMKFGVRGIRK